MNFIKLSFCQEVSDIIGKMGNVEETFSGATTNFLFISTNDTAENNFDS